MMSSAQDDPLIVAARREALVCGVVWLLATSVSVGTCATTGYGRSAESLTFVLGFPDWIFWGIVVPWLVSTAFSAWFCMFVMADANLEEDDLVTESTPG